MKQRWLAVLLVLILLLSSCARPEVAMTEVQFVLGTVVSLDIRDHASETLMKSLTSHLTLIENLMSPTIKTSDVYRLNHAGGQALLVSNYTYAVLGKALEYARVTRELFDPTLGTLINIWGIGTDGAKIPSQHEIDSAIVMRGIDNVEMLGKYQVRLTGNAQLDLGAIAKGYAADELVRLAKRAGVQSAIFNLGGNVIVLGSKGTNPFRIAIQNPFSERDDYLGILDARDTSIVTSGDYERYFIGPDGTKYHHILDPRTGFPADNELASITIVCPNSTLADALSTAVYVMGLEAGLGYVNSLEGVEAIFVTKTRDVYLTRGIGDSFTLTDDTFRLMQ